MNRKLLIAAVVLVLAAAGAFAQTTDSHTVTITITPVQVLDLDDTNDIAFTTTAPVLPGDPVGPAAAAPATDASKWLWYTTCTTATSRITVETDVAAPAGTALEAEATTVPVGGTVAAGPIDLSGVTAATELIGSIPNGNTGRAVGNGSNVTFRFWVDDPAALVVGAATVITVTYTIEDDA
jgi:hypothetical protein